MPARHHEHRGSWMIPSVGGKGSGRTRLDQHSSPFFKPIEAKSPFDGGVKEQRKKIVALGIKPLAIEKGNSPDATLLDVGALLREIEIDAIGEDFFTNPSMLMKADLALLGINT